MSEKKSETAAYFARQIKNCFEKYHDETAFPDYCQQDMDKDFELIVKNAMNSALDSAANAVDCGVATCKGCWQKENASKIRKLKAK